MASFGGCSREQERATSLSANSKLYIKSRSWFGPCDSCPRKYHVDRRYVKYKKSVVDVIRDRIPKNATAIRPRCTMGGKPSSVSGRVANGIWVLIVSGGCPAVRTKGEKASRDVHV